MFINMIIFIIFYKKTLILFSYKAIWQINIELKDVWSQVTPVTYNQIIYQDLNLEHFLIMDVESYFLF